MFHRDAFREILMLSRAQPTPEFINAAIRLDFISSTGVISQNNIDRFHITLFGQNLLEHIVIDS